MSQTFLNFMGFTLATFLFDNLEFQIEFNKQNYEWVVAKKHSQFPSAV